ncbi:MAG TPA: hypothetical protein ENH29_07595 [Bacteroidetes bacterium]|nr:hypothetical protein [Bacteroidota bacterium]
MSFGRDLVGLVHGTNKILPVLKKTTGCCCAYLTENLEAENEIISFTIREKQSYALQYEESGLF